MITSLLSLLLAAAPAPGWQVPAVSGTYENALVVQQDEHIRAVDISRACDLALSGTWDGRRFQVRLQPLGGGGKGIEGTLDFGWSDTLLLRLARPTPVCPGEAPVDGWKLASLTPSRQKAIVVPRTDSLRQALGRERFFATPSAEPDAMRHAGVPSGLEWLKDLFGRFETDEHVPDDEPLVEASWIGVRGDEERLPLKNLRVLPVDSFPIPPTVPAWKAGPAPRISWGNPEAKGDPEGMKILADSGLQGWSVQQATFAHGVLNLRWSILLVSPEREATPLLWQYTGDEAPTLGTFLADSAAVCREAATTSYETWHKELAQWLRQNGREFGEPARPTPSREARFTGAAQIGSAFGAGLRLCMGEQSIPWRSETDSGFQTHLVPFLVYPEEQGWKPALSASSALRAVDSAQSGLVRGAPDLPRLFSVLESWNQEHELSSLRGLAGTWRRAPREDGLRLCLEPARGQGSDCLEVDSSGIVQGTPRLSRLPGWRKCLGLSCPDLDTAKIFPKAREWADALWRADQRHLEENQAHASDLSDLYFSRPDAPWSASVALSPKKAWTGKVCLDAGPNHGCLLIDGKGAVKGTGLFKPIRYAQRQE